ncbi:MAG: amidohydrolase family protein [Methylocystaceae bacterium]
MIIDSHGHLGDILYPGGGELIYRRGVVKEKMWDPQVTNEKQFNRSFGLGKLAYLATGYWATKAQRARNSTATLENFSSSLDASGVDYAVCLPIAPYVTFEDLARARAVEPRILPFTSIDFTTPHDIGAKLQHDVGAGAVGLKLHPVIQSVSLRDERSLQVLQAFAPLKKPVLIHAGMSHYYLGSEKGKNTPANGNIKDINATVRTFPEVNFIVGHAGLFWVKEVYQLMGCLPNVWVDISFQSPESVRRLVKSFGPERVLFGSDWPWGSREPHIKIVEVACRGDQALQRRILCDNARELLGI